MRSASPEPSAVPACVSCSQAPEEGGARRAPPQRPARDGGTALSMKIHALYDDDGRIMAAVPVVTTAKAATPTPQPVPRRGQRVGVFPLPKGCEHLSFPEACAQLMVKAVGQRASLVLRPSKP